MLSTKKGTKEDTNQQEGDLRLKGSQISVVFSLKIPPVDTRPRTRLFYELMVRLNGLMKRVRVQVWVASLIALIVCAGIVVGVKWMQAKIDYIQSLDNQNTTDVKK
jgi:hypothetical protein